MFGTKLLQLVLVGISLTASCASSQWQQLGKSGAPSPRFGAASVYCPGRDSFIVHGGFTEIQQSSTLQTYSPLTDLWEYKFGSGWRLVPSSSVLSNNPSQTGRRYASMNVISSNSSMCEMVMYGGAFQLNDIQDLNQATDEMWYLLVTSQGAVWTKVNGDVGPGPRAHHRMVDRRGNFIFLGGMTYDAYTSTAYNDLWELSLNRTGDTLTAIWTEIGPPGESTPWIKERASFAMALIPGNNSIDDRLVVYGGMYYLTYLGLKFTENTMGDLVSYSFGTNSWTTLRNSDLEASGVYGLYYKGKFLVYGGNRLYWTLRSNTYVQRFNDLLILTDLNADLTLSDGVRGPGCAAKGDIGLWCAAFSNTPADQRPSARYRYAFGQRNNQLLVFGGIKDDPNNEFWLVDASTTFSDLALATYAEASGSDLASTVYFMIAILTLMVICFIVFVFSLRRHRSRQPMFFMTMTQNVQRPVGARASFVEGLPLKTFHKAHATLRSDGESTVSAAAGLPQDDKAPEAENPETTPKESSNDVEEDELHNMCAICLADYEEGESLRVLPCNHYFHPTCVDQWLSNHNACPMCKAIVDPEPLLYVPENTIVVPIPASASPAQTQNETQVIQLQDTAVPSGLESAPDPTSNQGRENVNSANV